MDKLSKSLTIQDVSIALTRKNGKSTPLVIPYDELIMKLGNFISMKTDEFISYYDELDEVHEFHWIGNEGVDTIFIHKPTMDIELSKGFKNGMYPSKKIARDSLSSYEKFIAAIS